jgi:hypothetical protein
MSFIGWFLLLAVVAGAIALVVARRRATPEDPPAPATGLPPARDTRSGRNEAGTAAPSPGSALGVGLAGGLALGAGALAAQEFGRRTTEQGQPGDGPRPQDGSDADSPLARDAGLGALQGNTSYRDLDLPQHDVAHDGGWQDAEAFGGFEDGDADGAGGDGGGD